MAVAPVLPLRTFPPLSRIEGSGFLHQQCFDKAYPPFIHSPSVLALRAQWCTEANDILICTAQKVGTHLAKKYLVELLRRLHDLPGSHPLASGDIGHAAVPWPEVLLSQEGETGWQRFLRQASDHPRLWYTHSTLDDLPCHRIHPQTRFVVVVRDPRGVAVSQYHFWRRHHLLEVDPSLRIDGFVRLFLGKDLYFGNYHEHVLSWLDSSRRSVLRPDLDPSQICVLTYEDMVEHKLETAKRLQHFLQPCSTLPLEELEAIAATTDFGAMKQHISRDRGSFHFNPATFFRSGTVDSWRQELAPSSIEAIDAATREHWGGRRGGVVLERYCTAAMHG